MSSGKRAADRRDYRPQTPVEFEAPDRLTRYQRSLVDWAKRKQEENGTLGILLEGDKIIKEALKAGLRLASGWFTIEASAMYPDVIAGLRRAGCSLRPLNPRQMRLISDLETSPGLVVAAYQPSLVLKSPTDPYRLMVALFGAQDPGNVGGVIRTADYFGADEVWLDRVSADPYGPKAIRGSMGAFLRMPVFRGDLEHQIKRFKGAGVEVWAAVSHGENVSKLPSKGKRILMLGSESRGLSAQELKLADKLVTISGAGRSESLNLGVAAGILIHQAMGS